MLCLTITACSTTAEVNTVSKTYEESVAEAGTFLERAWEPEEVLPAELSETELSETELPLYFRSAGDVSTIRLYFADEKKEIPYLDADTVKELTERVFHEANLDEDFALSLSSAGPVVTLIRENGGSMEIDCDADVISFCDYDTFCAPSWSNTVIDVLEHYGTIDCLQPVEENSYSRCGAPVDFHLGDYGIDLIEKDGVCYIPMQVLSDIVFSLPCYVNLLYNGEGVFAYELTMDPQTDLLEKYYEAEPGTRSETLADFTYSELCMVMDYFYGLKEQHDIEDFNDFFIETGLEKRLKSTDALEAGKAMADLMILYIDDLHSSYDGNSWLIGPDAQTVEKYGRSIWDFSMLYWTYSEARAAYYPDGVPGYEEIGNTAYITFDSFGTKAEDADYYDEAPTADTTDVVGLCLYAFSQITREDSPIENVVLDLSLNSGGDSTTASFVLSMFLGEAGICIEDTMTDAYANESFRADANLDGVFNEQDSLLGYNLYCLTSPNSFSCGNLVPCVLKNTGRVTMLGITSGGGTCIVMPFSTADGTLLQTSGCRRLSYMKNGALYDIDQGVEPHYMITIPEHFYDRQTLTEYINGLY
ncbi:MAG: hypothetical protein IKI75_12430 [Lachnospiraceae bacterium]|nr:hypothetical protein [Lachnospiraceae bacterium]